MLNAVVVGIDHYADPEISNLGCARADAEAVAEFLREAVTPAEASIRILLDAHATRTEILKSIGEVLPRQQHRDDFVLIYFAGHGSPEQASPPDRTARYLVPHDAEYAHLFATGIGLEREIVEVLDRQIAGRVLLVLDACFSGRAGGRTFLGPNLKRSLALRRGARLSLRELHLGFGSVVLAACQDDEVATEQPSHGHGIFTFRFIEALRAGPGPSIGLGELYDRVYRHVTSDSKERQHPVLAGRIAGLRLPCLTG